MNEIGLGDSANIIKYKQINGETIMVADEEYLNDTLGMLKTDEQ